MPPSSGNLGARQFWAAAPRVRAGPGRAVLPPGAPPPPRRPAADAKPNQPPLPPRLAAATAASEGSGSPTAGLGSDRYSLGEKLPNFTSEAPRATELRGRAVTFFRGAPSLSDSRLPGRARHVSPARRSSVAAAPAAAGLPRGALARARAVGARAASPAGPPPRVPPRPGRGRPPRPSAALGQRPRLRPAQPGSRPRPRGLHLRICCARHHDQAAAHPRFRWPRPPDQRPQVRPRAPKGPGLSAARPARVTAWERRAVRGRPRPLCAHARPGCGAGAGVAAQHGGRLAARSPRAGAGAAGRPGRSRRWRRRSAAPRASSPPPPRSLRAALPSSRPRPAAPLLRPLAARSWRARHGRVSMRPAACAPALPLPRPRPGPASRPGPRSRACSERRPAARTPGRRAYPRAGAGSCCFRLPGGVPPQRGPGGGTPCARS